MCAVWSGSEQHAHQTRRRRTTGNWSRHQRVSSLRNVLRCPGSVVRVPTADVEDVGRTQGQGQRGDRGIYYVQGLSLVPRETVIKIISYIYFCLSVCLSVCLSLSLPLCRLLSLAVTPVSYSSCFLPPCLSHSSLSPDLLLILCVL